MQRLSAIAARPGLGLGALGAAVGVSVQGPDQAIIWAIVAYFLGKAIQSTVWTLTAGSST